MNPTFLSQSAKPGHNSPGRLLLSLGLPLLLVLAFLGRQVLNFDSIGWQHGFTHPLSGWDHLVTMLAVGIWAAQLRGRAIWMLPLAFVGVMSLGGLAGAAGLELPNLEGIILLSGAVFGVLISRKIRFNNKINVFIVAFFGFCHGYAHGQEISTSASLISYTLGFMLATLLLHGAGILVAKLVVLAITCLLTMVFSSAALAKAAADLPDIDASFAKQADLSKTAMVWSASVAHRQVQDYLAGQVDNLYAEDSGGGSSVKQTVSPNKPVGSFTQQQQADSLTHVLSLENAVLLEQAHQAAIAVYPDYLSDNLLDFKHQYPDINHTPGTHLLSNGVGLTSPPLLYAFVSAPQQRPDFRNIPILFPVDRLFTFHPVGFSSSNPNAKTISLSRPIAASQPVWQDMAALYSNYRHPYSTTTSHAEHPNPLITGGIYPIQKTWRPSG